MQCEKIGDTFRCRCQSGFVSEENHCEGKTILNFMVYGYHQRENTGSRLLTEVKPCWTGLISGWMTIQIKYPVLYSLGSQAGVVNINHAFHLYYIVVCGLSISRSQPDYEGFLRALRFPPSSKLTPRQSYLLEGHQGEYFIVIGVTLFKQRLFNFQRKSLSVVT